MVRGAVRPAAPGPTDGELLRRFASGRDGEAFAALVRRHGGMVYSACRRVLGPSADADDAFQATFLVLARRAGGLRWRASAAGWLYAVAMRLARKAKIATARRQERERQAVPPPAADPLAALTLRDTQAVLDEELGRLPARLRDPLVLCCLEGRTRDEAARQLGWPLGTLKRRLEQARGLLRARLARRGLTVPAALAAALVGEAATSAAVPAALAESAASAALASAAAGPAVTRLAFGAGAPARVKLAAAVVLAGLALAGAAVVLAPGETEPPPAATATTTAARDAAGGGAAVVRLPVDQAQRWCCRAEPLGDKGYADLGARYTGPAAVVANLPPDFADLIRSLPGSFEDQGERRVPRVRAGLGMTLLTVGPYRNNGESFRPPRLVRSGASLRLDIEYEDFAAGGLKPPVETSYLPVVLVPLRLSPGPYRLTTTWRAVLPKQHDGPAKMPPRVSTLDFEVFAADLSESPAVAADGVEFRAVADRVWPVPRPGEAVTVDLGLRVVNHTGRKIELFDTTLVSLARAGRPQALREPVVRTDDGPWPTTVPPGREDFFSRQATLRWEPDGSGLRLSGKGSPGPWEVGGLRPGRYPLRLTYASFRDVWKKELKGWEGRAEPAAVTVEVRAGPPGGELPPADRDVAWAGLAAKDRARGRWAVWTLAACPSQALPLVQANVRPATERLDRATLARLVADLDSDRFETRERATAELTRQRDLAGPALRRALADGLPPEARRRVEAVLKKLEEDGPTPDRQRALRAVEVLEEIGSPEARTLLRELARGAAEDPLTRRARECLDGLGAPP
jgi:RNA polymerase sigma factor (sigma-70 family)